VWRAVREAHRRGKSCPPLVEMSIRELLAMDLHEARARFNIGEPTWYRRCHEVWKREGVNPYDLLGKAGEAAEEKLAA